jgi:hypothetical protein
MKILALMHFQWFPPIGMLLFGGDSIAKTFVFVVQELSLYLEECNDNENCLAATVSVSTTATLNKFVRG